MELQHPDSELWRERNRILHSNLNMLLSTPWEDCYINPRTTEFYDETRLRSFTRHQFEEIVGVRPELKYYTIKVLYPTRERMYFSL